MVALRADIDALPLTDPKDVPYRSTVDGVCHACGHDVHTTVLLGVGMLLAQLAERGELDGRVRLIFQPAEEILPCGSLEVIEAGGLDDVAQIFALHCDPNLPVGPGRPAGRPDHRRRRQRHRPAHRPGRAHRPPAPDRRPGRRARPAGHRGARPWSAAGCRPTAGCCWSSATPRPAPATTSSRPRRSPPAPCG